MFPYQQYNVDKELLDCLEIIYDLIDFLDDIRLVLETEKDLTPIIHQPLPSWQLSLLKNALIWLQTWERFPFITLFL